MENAMHVITSQQVQTKFGEFSDLVKTLSGEPVVITQHKRPTMAVFAYAEAMEMMRLSAKMRFLQGLRENGEHQALPSDDELAEVSRLIVQERELVYEQGKSS